MACHKIILWIVAVVSGVLLLAAGQETPRPSAPGEVTFTHDAAPILYKNCVTCHRPNDIAPMSLLTYTDARPWAKLIRDAVVERRMPPWHVDPNVGDFLNDPRLSDADISTIDAWFRTGAQEGDAKDLPPAPVFTQGWHIKPDIVFSIPEFTVSGTSQDEYEYIYVPTNFTEDKWVQAAEVLPGDRRVVHHATVSVITGDQVAKEVAEHSGSNAGVDQYDCHRARVHRSHAFSREKHANGSDLS
jgi:mono/diheme cytochrome c family protein